MKFFILSIFISFNLLANDAKDFSLLNYEDKTEFKLKEYLGKKTIVLNFWASWCTACIQELPELHELQKKYPKAIFIGINSGERVKLIKKFLRRYKFHYKILIDQKKSVAKLYDVTALPMTIVINKNRKISFKDSKPPKSLR